MFITRNVATLWCSVSTTIELLLYLLFFSPHHYFSTVLSRFMRKIVIRYNKLRKKKKGDNVPVTDGDSLI